tara:strand:+ start:146 stop:400 length:255 start_codon:yes stop_codon:yes gene_type:complete
VNIVAAMEVLAMLKPFLGRIVDHKKPVSMTNASTISGAGLITYGVDLVGSGTQENQILGVSLIVAGLCLLFVKSKDKQDPNILK